MKKLYPTLLIFGSIVSFSESSNEMMRNSRRTRAKVPQAESCHGQAEKYRLILENVRDFAIFSADLEGRVDEWNPGAERLFGYSAEEMIGKPMEMIYVPEDRAAGKAEMEKAVAAETGRSEDERWHLRKDGSRLFVMGMVNAMYDHDGKLCGFIKVARDITPRKILSDQLAASEARHRMIFETIQDFAVVTLDMQGNIETWNPGAKVTFGYEAEEVVGKNFSVLFTPEDRQNHIPERMLLDVRKEGFRHTEGWAMRKDGGKIFTIDALRLMPNDHAETKSILKVSRDITIRHVTRMQLEKTQRELEQARQELEIKVEQRTAALQESVKSLEQVLHHVAHDLRAPLRTMAGFTSILMEKYAPTLDPEAERLTDRISAAAERMDHLIQDLLVFGRLCVNPVEREKMMPEAPLQAALVNLEALIRRSEAKIEVVSPLRPVFADFGVLRQVFWELISNALTFVVPDRQVQVKIWSEQRGNLARISIEDNGKGIPAEHLDRIFWIFERLSHSASLGTGMGLAIVRKAMERMGGRIGVESSPGTGSRFWIELPAAQEGE